ncbi:MAG: hypothetical protein ACYS6W_04845 [Planctomycetota bacterium]|jgi:hypothetical protein
MAQPTRLSEQVVDTTLKRIGVEGGYDNDKNGVLETDDTVKRAIEFLDSIAKLFTLNYCDWFAPRKLDQFSGSKPQQWLIPALCAFVMGVSKIGLCPLKFA